MPPMAKNAAADVIHLDSDSDTDDGVGGRRMFRSIPLLMENQQVPCTIDDVNVAPRETLDCRSFWKAGENFVNPNIVTPTALGNFFLCDANIETHAPRLWFVVF